MKIKNKIDGEEFVLPHSGRRKIGHSVKNYVLEFVDGRIILSYESNVGGNQHWINIDVTDEYTRQ